MKPRDLDRLPLPELINGKPWDVGEAVGQHAGTNVKAREMLVPVEGECELCGADHNRYVRCHELTHAKFSKGSIVRNAAKYGVSAEAYQLAEENFIEAINIRSYPDLGPGVCMTPDGKVHEVRDRVAMGIRNGNVEMAARMAIAAASGNTPMPEKMPDSIVSGSAQHHIYYALECFCRQVMYTVKKLRYGQANIVKVAQMIQSFLETLDEAAEEDRKRQGEGDKPKGPMKQVPQPGKGGGEKEEKFRGGRHLAEVMSQAIANPSTKKPKWGVMELIHPPRPINLNKKFGVRKYRASPEGARIRNISRFYTDQKVFGRKRRYKGGTLLVDASGSMSFSRQDLEDIVQQVPAATIALYSGAGGHGFLRVIAKGGTCAESKWMKTPGGNEVDGPALDWLGKQREPRIWYSDGEVVVTGQKSRWENQGALREDASKKCRKFNIRRVRHLHQAQEAFDNPSIGVRTAYVDSKMDYEQDSYEPEYIEDEDDG